MRLCRRPADDRITKERVDSRGGDLGCRGGRLLSSTNDRRMVLDSSCRVWTAEALNTAFEFLTDVASPQFHPLAGKAKDVAAGAVLIAALGSVVIGILVLGPHVVSEISSWR